MIKLQQKDSKLIITWSFILTVTKMTFGKNKKVLVPKMFAETFIAVVILFPISVEILLNNVFVWLLHRKWNKTYYEKI